MGPRQQALQKATTAIHILCYKMVTQRARAYKYILLQNGFQPLMDLHLLNQIFRNHFVAPNHMVCSPILSEVTDCVFSRNPFSSADMR